MANDGWHSAWTPEISAIVDDRAKFYGVNPEDIRRIIWHESRGNPAAKNPKSSASGLMQLLQGTFKLKNPFDPYENIDRGTKFYADMLKQFNGDKALAARAYAWGPGWTRQWLKNGRSLDGMSDLARSTFGTGEEFSSYMTGQKSLPTISATTSPAQNPVTPTSPPTTMPGMQQPQSPLSWTQSNPLIQPLLRQTMASVLKANPYLESVFNAVV